jgi:PST family polysaccharide transporter
VRQTLKVIEIKHPNGHVPGMFNVPTESEDLKARSVRSGAVTLASQGVLYLIQLATVAILARLLTPEDYGLVAMVTAVTVFAGLFKDLGLSSATVQKRVVTHDQLSTMFWMNIATGLAITALVVGLAPVVSWFYQEPKLLYVTLALAPTFLVGSLGTQHGALLARQMRFTAIAVVDTASILVTLLVSVVIAVLGGGYWALVWGSLAGTTARNVGVWLASDWRPGWPVRGSGTRGLLAFGVNVTGFDVANYFHRNLDNVLIGATWGPEQLGLYNRAYALLMLPIANLRGPLNRVAFPALSRLQEDPRRYRSYFMRYVSILAFLSMPLVGLVVVCSREIITLVLGPRWMGAYEIFLVLALGALIQPVAGLRGLVLMSSGQGGRYLRWGVYNAVATSVAFVCGLPWGAQGVAAAYTIVNFLILHPSLTFSFRNTPLRPGDFYVGISRPLTATLVMSVALFILRAKLPVFSTVGVLVVSSFCAVAFFLASFALLPGGWTELQEFCAIGMKLFHRSPLTASNEGAPPGDEAPEDFIAVEGGKRP